MENKKGIAPLAAVNSALRAVVSRIVVNLLTRIFVFCCVCAPAAAATLHIDDFQSAGAMSWMGSFPSPTWQATGGPAGNGDAFLRVFSDGSANLATHNSRPDWTGNYQSVRATSVSVDMMMTSPTTDNLNMRIVMFGPQSTGNRWTSQLPVLVPNDGIWRNYQFSLASPDLSLVFGNADYDSLIADVVRIMLRHDPGGPSAQGTTVNAVLGVDNVRLIGSADPVPGDYDGDGTVGPADYDAWKDAYAVSVEPGTGADGNGDGIITAADYTAWRDNLNAAVTGNVSPIPEPPTHLLAMLTVITMLANWIRKCRTSSTH